MINFTVGPVQSDDTILKISAEQVPYFRTKEFSDLMLENEALMKKFVNAPKSARVVFMTGSGTASMEATVMNTLTEKDRALVVNGGGFGSRFAELLDIHQIPYDEIKIEPGKSLKEKDLAHFDPKKYTAFLVNVHETSTGVHYNLNMIHDFCSKNNIFLIVDAISSFLADENDFKKNNMDVLITGSQKALACPPGISIIVMSERAVKRIENNDPHIMYFNLKDALKNMERGQTPFTPAVGILRQINARLKQIEQAGGPQNEIEKVSNLAKYFRERIADLPFEEFPESPSNAVTALHPTTASANDIFLILKDEYDIWVCPNGGDMKDKVFRVGHIGSLTTKEYDKLINAFHDLKKRGII